MTVLPLIFLSVLINVTAQLLLKQGMMRVGYFAFAWENVTPVAVRILSDPFILLGILSYVVSVTVWLLVLSRTDVSYAYPIISMGYILTAIAAYFFLHEPLTIARIVGIFVIMVGVYLVSRS
jgi:drug/metabolite transporter (DMT)-like permease